MQHWCHVLLRRTELTIILRNLHSAQQVITDTSKHTVTIVQAIDNKGTHQPVRHFRSQRLLNRPEMTYVENAGPTEYSNGKVCSDTAL